MELSDDSSSNILDHFGWVSFLKIASDTDPAVTKDDLNMFELDCQESEDRWLLGLFANDQNVLGAYVIYQWANISDVEPVVLIEVFVGFEEESVHLAHSLIDLEVIINEEVGSGPGNRLAEIWKMTYAHVLDFLLHWIPPG